MSPSEVAIQHVVSERENIGSWQGPFFPWRNEEFQDPEKPVVCVSYYEARQYCHWVNNLNKQVKAYTFLPSPELWDITAFQTTFPSYNPDTMFTGYQRIHHKEAAPAAIDRTNARSNNLGISDLLGNVWEWCEKENPTVRSILTRRSYTVELRGGGFLDDLSMVKPALSSDMLLEGVETRHFDLGFRIAAIIPIEDLPEEVQKRMSSRRYNI
jgi:formylglycine-generating enzyme required for sulfatase activity